MAVGAWTFFKHFKGNLGKAAAALNSGNWRIVLCTSAALFSAAKSLSTYASISGELATSNGYTAGGGAKGLLTQTWVSALSAGNWRFNYSPARIWTAGGGSISNIKFAAIMGSAGVKPLVCFSQLSTSPFNITTGNTLTLTASGTGIFNLS